MRVEGVRTTPVVIPLTRPVTTASGTVDRAPLVLIDLRTTDGVVGHAYLFSYYPWALAALDRLVGALAEMIVDDPVAPVALGEKLRGRALLLGGRNLVGMAIAGLDMAAWDACARAAGVPLVRLLGGSPLPMRAYDSLGMLAGDAAGAAAAASVEAGFRGLKIRLGFPDLEDDLAAVRAARAAVPDDVELMVDYNQSLSGPEAVRRGRALDGEGVCWIEEPVRADDLMTCARVAAQVATPVQLGENLGGIPELRQALHLDACDLVMPDVQQIGGITGWLRAAAIAEAAGRPVSNHLFVETSAHLLAVAPTRHRLEWLDLASPVLRDPARVVDGTVVAAARPGAGLEWDEDAVARYRVRD